MDLTVTQEDLAGWVGASRESVARALATLRRTKIVTTGRRVVTVHDLARLAEIAGRPECVR
jgi:CRP-like cAMP-binding protein